MKRIFIETQNVQRLRKVVGMAVDTEKGRPGMVAVWGEAGSGKTEAAQMLYAEHGFYLRAMEGVTQCAFMQDLCYEVKGSRPRIIDRIPQEFRVPFGKIERADVLLFALEAADLNLSPEAAALIHTEAKGIFRRVHNCVLSVESAARVAGVREVSADLVNSVLAGTSNVSNTRAGCKKARR